MARAWKLLWAETSYNLFWGEAWVPRLHADLDEAMFHIARAQQALGAIPSAQRPAAGHG